MYKHGAYFSIEQPANTPREHKIIDISNSSIASRVRFHKFCLRSTDQAASLAANSSNSNVLPCRVVVMDSDKLQCFLRLLLLSCSIALDFHACLRDSFGQNLLRGPTVIKEIFT